MLKKILIIVPAVLIAVGVAAYFTLPALLVTAALEGQRSEAGLTVKTLDVDDHTITYLEGGSGEILLLLHGYGADKDNWVSFAERLVPNYRVIALDLPGWAESTYLSNANYGVYAQADRLDAIAKALKLESHHVAGNSMGGWIAAVYAHKYPEDILSLGLVNNAGIITPEPSEFDVALQKGENLLLVNSVEDFDRILSFVFVTPPDIPGPIKSYLAKTGAARTGENTKIMRDLEEDPVNIAPLLPDLNMPVFILWGDQDRLIDVSAVEVMEPLIRHSTVAVLENVGHLPMIEKPEKSAKLYDAFIKASGSQTP